MVLNISLSLNGGCRVVTEQFTDNDHFNRWQNEMINNGYKIIGIHNVELKSNCCDAKPLPESDVCSKCLEHSELI